MLRKIDFEASSGIGIAWTPWLIRGGIAAALYIAGLFSANTGPVKEVVETFTTPLKVAMWAGTGILLVQLWRWSDPSSTPLRGFFPEHRQRSSFREDY